MTPLKIRNSTLKLYVSNGILLVTSVFAFCPPQKTLITENDRDLNDRIFLFSLSHAARYSERSSDSGQNADGYLQNCFPSVRFHLFSV